MNQTATQTEHTIDDAAHTPPDLKQAWATYRELHPKTRTRDAAVALGASEAQLVATACGEHVMRLAIDDNGWGDFIKQFDALGRVMALTRNAEAVSERKGAYSRVELFPQHGMGQVLDEGIDLRLFLTHWRHGFAVRDATRNGTRRSLQFFDPQGNAIHKVFLLEGSDDAAFDELTTRYASDDQSATLAVEARATPAPKRPDGEIDVAAFQQGWLALQNTHEFFGLTRKFNVTRTQALRLAPPLMTARVAASSLRQVLEEAAVDDSPIMIFVGNHGCIQIHTGAVSNIKVMNEWLNVLDPDFNLHVREDLIAEAWVVRKPTTDGNVSSLELYNADGEQIALVFSKRKPGQIESEAWRERLAHLPTLNG